MLLEFENVFLMGAFFIIGTFFPQFGGNVLVE